jgi:hypothetical protein
MTTPGGLVLVDWDTALLAPPERDLWDMAGDDRSLLDHYTRATGVQIDPEALALYRLWFDLAEISEYLTLFHAPHGHTADTAESWENLRHFLRPAERWPALCNPGQAAREPEAHERAEFGLGPSVALAQHTDVGPNDLGLRPGDLPGTGTACGHHAIACQVTR